jgi:hypothetical protein
MTPVPDDTQDRSVLRFSSFAVRRSVRRRKMATFNHKRGPGNQLISIQPISTKLATRVRSKSTLID